METDHVRHADIVKPEPRIVELTEHVLAQHDAIIQANMLLLRLLCSPTIVVKHLDREDG